MCNVKAKGAQIKTRALFLEKGECNTHYFMSLEKSRQIHNVVETIKCDNGDHIESERIILQHIRSFYDKLHISDNVCNDDIQHYLDDIDFDTVLSDEQTNRL